MERNYVALFLLSPAAEHTPPTLTNMQNQAHLHTEDPASGAIQINI